MAGEEEIGEFDAESAERIADAVRWVESQPDNRRPQPRRKVKQAAVHHQFVRVTSATVTSGTQPGKLQVLNAGVLSDGADVLVKSRDGSVLATRTYECRLVQVDSSSGKAVFMPRDGKDQARKIVCHLVQTLSASDASQPNCPVDYYFDGGNPGATVTLWNRPVFNPSGTFMFSGPTGQTALAEYDDVAGKYWIYQLQC